jgi:transcriptional regulator with XRE-family HTH domain
MSELSYRIRQARRRATMSQSDLATSIGVNRSAVAQWERRDGSRPTSENLSRVAVLTAVQFEWLATGRGRMLPAGEDDADVSALMLRVHAHDEVEERILMALRKLDYWQSIVIAEMVEAFGRGRHGTLARARPTTVDAGGGAK